MTATPNSTTVVASQRQNKNKLIIPILSVLLFLSVLLLIKDYYFNRSFYNPSVNNESQIDDLLTSKNILTIFNKNDNHHPAEDDTEDAATQQGVVSSTKQSSKTASQLDSENCNNQGFYYTDINGCNCFSCFYGVHCENFDQDCVINDVGGNPLLFEEYWRNISNSNENGSISDESTATEPIYYRSPYQMYVMSKINISSNASNSGSKKSKTFSTISGNKNTNNKNEKKNENFGSSATSGSGFLYPYLANQIGEIHQYVNNIDNLDSKYVVLGSGATELIGAAMYACKELYQQQQQEKKAGAASSGTSSSSSSDQVYVYAKVPYYEGYPANLLTVGVENLQFSTNESLNAEQVIEFVTYPNNPTNTFREATYGNNALCTIYDQVYWWPSMSNLTQGGAPLNTQISLFSFSKITGHGGSRLGWALVDDYNIANLMSSFIRAIQVHISIDTQLRAYRVFNYLLADAPTGVAKSSGGASGGVKNADLFFSWVHDKLAERWVTVEGIFNASTSGKFVQQATPGGFYAWINCLDTSKLSCEKQFEVEGIAPTPGSNFGGDDSYVRMELVTADAVWDVLVQRLKNLITA